ncbi:MAG TPA: SDR family oxidoreductase [Mycobacteriales bacterium]|nr:SDR family oxidoreductase [Mycobacteriales bacterium]
MTEVIALVTGANKGIGREIVDQLARRGMTVLLGARDEERRAAAAAELRGSGDVRPVALDVTDQASVDAAAAWIEAEFGRLDVLVNNAGITGGQGQQPAEADLATVRAAYEVNVFGVQRVTNAMLPLLARSAAPRIVNMSSSVGSLAIGSDLDGPYAVMPGSAAYVPSKTALNSLTVQYAKQLRKDGVLVNAACPGYCATDLNNHAGHRTPAQGAAIAVRLATLAPDGPTGGFFDDAGPVPW